MSQGINSLAGNATAARCKISNLAQGWCKDETHKWDEDELLELVVAQFGDREAQPSVHRLLSLVESSKKQILC